MVNVKFELGSLLGPQFTHRLQFAHFSWQRLHHSLSVRQLLRDLNSKRVWSPSGTCGATQQEKRKSDWQIWCGFQTSDRETMNAIFKSIGVHMPLLSVVSFPSYLAPDWRRRCPSATGVEFVIEFHPWSALAKSLPSPAKKNKAGSSTICVVSSRLFKKCCQERNCRPSGWLLWWVPDFESFGICRSQFCSCLGLKSTVPESASCFPEFWICPLTFVTCSSHQFFCIYHCRTRRLSLISTDK